MYVAASTDGQAFMCSYSRFKNILSLVMVLNGQEDQVTSIFQMQLLLPQMKHPVVLQRCLFDSGALCKYSLIASSVVEKLKDKLVISPVQEEVRPFSGSAIACLGLTRITLSVKDVYNIRHTASDRYGMCVSGSRGIG